MSNFFRRICMNKLMQFEGNNVEVIQDENGDLLFEIYSTGMALGYITFAKGKAYPQKVRIDKIVENAEITLVVHGVQLFLNESQLYDFMLEARTDKCRKFRKWVTNDVLPSIRKTGVYCTSAVSDLASQPEYQYIDKTYHAQPVMTVADISHIFDIPAVALYSFITSCLTADTDYILLCNDTLKMYLEENPSAPRCKKSLYIISHLGLRQIIDHFDLDTKKFPKAITQTRGYVVQADVRRVMEYVRQEIKGIEVLTYLVESNDTLSNLENYRKILTKKLSAMSWWKTDVDTIKLGIHNITRDEMTQIHFGHMGLKY